MWRRHLSADRVLMLLLGISLCINVAIVVLALNREPVRAPADVIQGDVLAAITGISGRGETRTIRFDGLTKPIVLYVFSETCTWCQRNRSAISALFRAASDRFEFIGVSLGPVRDPTATLSLGVEFPTLTPTGRLPFLSTPQTVVVDQGGEVIRAWRGAYVGRIHSAIEQYFDVILPASDVR